MLLCAALALGAFALAAYGQQPNSRINVDELPPSIQDIVRKHDALMGEMAGADQATLDEVRNAFLKAPRIDPKLHAVLQRIRLDVPLFDVRSPEVRPDARAPRSAVPRVTINQMMTFEIWDIAGLAARRMLTALAGIPEDYPRNSLLDQTHYDIRQHTLAWIVAHEMAHHHLGHVGRDPATVEESRLWELRADALAFAMLNETGFSIYLVGWYMEAKRNLEEQRRRYGALRTTEEASDHPSWQRRYEQLLTARLAFRPPPGDWIMLSTVVRVAEPGQLLKQTVMLPRSESNRAAIVLNFVSHATANTPDLQAGMAGVLQRSSGEVDVYFRADNQRTKCRLQNRNAVETRAECETDEGQGATRHTLTFYSDSFAGLLAQPRASKAREAFELFAKTGMLDLRRGILNELVSDPSTRATAWSIAERQVREYEEVVLRFTRGDFSQQEAEKRTSDNIAASRRELEAVLGRKTAADWETLFSERVTKALH